MAKFKCKHSGCVYEWFDESTIKDMRAHGEYSEEVEQAPPAAAPVAIPPVSETPAVVKAPKKQAKE